MRLNWSRLLSKLVEKAVLGLVAMAILADFLIIAQALFNPLCVVEGDSMYPYIKDQDAVLALAVEPRELKPGDVVIFPDPEQEGAYIVHRLVSLEEKDGRLFAVTKGDANPVTDPFAVPVNRIYGKVRLVIPLGGAFLNFLKSPAGFSLCVIMPFAVLLLYILAGKYRESRGEGGGFLLHQIIKA